MVYPTALCVVPIVPTICKICFRSTPVLSLRLPSSDLATLASLGRGAGAARLFDCLLLRPLSTVADLCEAVRREGLCAGDLVRAEARGVHRNHILAVTTVSVGGRAWWGSSFSTRCAALFTVRWVWIITANMYCPCCSSGRWQGHLAANADADDDGRAGRVAS